MDQKQFSEFFTEALRNEAVKNLLSDLFMANIVSPLEAKIDKLKEELREKDFQIKAFDDENCIHFPIHKRSITNSDLWYVGIETDIW